MLTLSTKVRLPEPVPNDRTRRDLGDPAATGGRGDVFGRCTDRFGVSWTVDTAGDAA